MEMKMRPKITTLLAISLLAAIAAPAAAASGHHHARAKSRAVAIEHFRNSNAYVAPTVQFPAVQPDMSDYDEGAMTSGPAGH